MSAPSIHEQITATIIEALSKGVRPWHQPWNVGSMAGRPLRANGLPYQGVNVLNLWLAADARGYSSRYWITYKQAQEIGAQVRGGERGSLVVFAKQYTKEEEGDDGETSEKTISFLKGYRVFNADQVDGLPAHFYQVPAEQPLARRVDRAEEFVRRTRADVRHGGARAYHSFPPSYIQMPPFVAFEDPEAYYSTLFHELTHWTRTPDRLDRDFGRTRWGDEGYAKEELVAELGAAFLCADLGITASVREDHAAYIKSWLENAKLDPRFIVSAASHASRAVDFLHSFQAEAIREAA